MDKYYQRVYFRIRKDTITDLSVSRPADGPVINFELGVRTADARFTVKFTEADNLSDPVIRFALTYVWDRYGYEITGMTAINMGRDSDRAHALSAIKRMLGA